ncbi:sigma-70 family RNA polymerase sigma factor [Streptomyces aidingensis]|uniref:RNA polymerase sigma-70 factor, ECF subfamily n=1 Tax=Streptomyces aidingensis TaxID=910347 RepID=A0A1I1T206_9ACTN|nr:sigma-70 family RNA polymerase sigma factor [Streptomyces aidingensis]SFD49320.1 RNA polymerase sigma-70 factor, ECF subfamily [Streptomyces aidingensis]
MSDSRTAERDTEGDSHGDARGASRGGTHGGTPTEVFTRHRELLFSIVYNMLGSIADTEDVLQETWLSWAGRQGRAAGAGEEIGNPRAYLVRIAVNHALAHRAVVSRRRETYVGPWLPEPLVAPDGPAAGESADAAAHAMRTESLSMALLVVLETLSPLERAVFILHEVFGYPHTEIAKILERRAPAVRQIARRARAHVHARRPRYQARPRVRQQVTERFVAAAMGGDLASLMEILAPEVTLWTDGGGKAPRSALRPVHGRERVARALTGYASRPPEGLEIRHRSVGGDAAAVVFTHGSPYAVMVMDLDAEGRQVSGVYLVTNPDKLARLETRGDGEA